MTTKSHPGQTQSDEGDENESHFILHDRKQRVKKSRAGHTCKTQTEKNCNKKHRFAEISFFDAKRKLLALSKFDKFFANRKLRIRTLKFKQKFKHKKYTFSSSLLANKTANICRIESVL